MQVLASGTSSVAVDRVNSLLDYHDEVFGDHSTDDNVAMDASAGTDDGPRYNFAKPLASSLALKLRSWQVRQQRPRTGAALTPPASASLEPDADTSMDSEGSMSSATLSVDGAIMGADAFAPDALVPHVPAVTRTPAKTPFSQFNAGAPTGTPFGGQTGRASFASALLLSPQQSRGPVSTNSLAGFPSPSPFVAPASTRKPPLAQAALATPGRSPCRHGR